MAAGDLAALAAARAELTDLDVRRAELRTELAGAGAALTELERTAARIVERRAAAKVIERLRRDEARLAAERVEDRRTDRSGA